MQKVKKRDTNFELLRIIAMFMIVTLHYTQNSGVLENNGTYTLQNIFFIFLNTVCSVGVNCFVLISGYYLITSKFKIQKIIHLWGLVLFYSLGIYLLYKITTHSVVNPMSSVETIYVFTPVLNVHYWFIVPYLALYIVFPFLNKMINTLNQKQLKVILIIFFVLMCVINNITPLNQNFEAVGGHSILWFMFLYGVGAYIKKYKNKDEGKDKYKYLLYFIIYIILGFIFKIIFENISSLNILLKYANYRVIAFNSVFAFLGAVFIFMFFKNIKVKGENTGKCISFVSKNVFAVYLIHEHELNRQVIWNTNLNINIAGMQNNFILHYLLCIFIIFTSCVLIEEIRRIVFEIFLKIPVFNKIQLKVHKKYNNINEKINEFIEA